MLPEMCLLDQSAPPPVQHPLKRVQGLSEGAVEPARLDKPSPVALHLLAEPLPLASHPMPPLPRLPHLLPSYLRAGILSCLRMECF